MTGANKPEMCYCTERIINMLRLNAGWCVRWRVCGFNGSWGNYCTSVWSYGLLLKRKKTPDNQLL